MIKGVKPGTNQGAEDKAQGRTRTGKPGYPPLLFMTDPQARQRHDGRHPKTKSQTYQQYCPAHDQLGFSHPEHHRASANGRYRHGDQQTGRGSQPLHDDDLPRQRSNSGSHHCDAERTGRSLWTHLKVILEQETQCLLNQCKTHEQHDPGH